jgi:hypothetical protein
MPNVMTPASAGTQSTPTVATRKRWPRVFVSFDGSINDIDAAKGKLKVLVNMFGRETPVELDGLQVKRV